MKELYGTSLTRRLLWALGLGLGAVVLVPLLMVWINTLTGLTETAPAPLTVSLRMLETTGWPWQRLLAAELGAAFASAPPWDWRCRPWRAAAVVWPCGRRCTCFSPRGSLPCCAPLAV